MTRDPRSEGLSSNFRNFAGAFKQAGHAFKNWDNCGQRPDQVRRVLDQTVTLLHSFAYQAEFTVLQITDSAVRHV